jgi:hypothetical protein
MELARAYATFTYKIGAILLDNGRCLRAVNSAMEPARLRETGRLFILELPTPGEQQQ